VHPARGGASEASASGSAHPGAGRYIFVYILEKSYDLQSYDLTNLYVLTLTRACPRIYL